MPSSTSITYLPRCTGEVRIAVEVSVRMLAWPSNPKRFGSVSGHAAEAVAQDVRNAVMLAPAAHRQRYNWRSADRRTLRSSRMMLSNSSSVSRRIE